MGIPLEQALADVESAGRDAREVTRDADLGADVEVDGIELQRVGGRVWVRFDHGAAALGTQAWRRMRQVFLRLLVGDRPPMAAGV